MPSVLHPESRPTATEDVLFDLRGPVATITLNRSAKHNALTLAMLAEIGRLLDIVEADPAVRVLVLRGAGQRFFCSGADIAEWGPLDPQAMAGRFIRTGNRICRRLAELDIPSIAVLRGNALGGGLELALSCDFRIACPDTLVGFPESSVGAIPGWMGCQRISALVGPSRARSLVLLGDPIQAGTAQAWGLLHQVVPQEELDDAVERVCGVLLSRSPTSLSVGKRMLRLVQEQAMDVAHELAAAVCKASPDAVEGLAAFREKRPALFGRMPSTAASGNHDTEVGIDGR